MDLEDRYFAQLPPLLHQAFVLWPGELKDNLHLWSQDLTAVAASLLEVSSSSADSRPDIAGSLQWVFVSVWMGSQWGA